jgi:hypothetical protein
MTLSEAQERIATDWRELGTDEEVLETPAGAAIR